MPHQNKSLPIALFGLRISVFLPRLRAALRGRPQRGQHEFPRSAWELDIFPLFVNKAFPLTLTPDFNFI